MASCAKCGRTVGCACSLKNGLCPACRPVPSTPKESSTVIIPPKIEKYAKR